MASKAPTTDPKRAVGYLRVSTEDQNLGPDAQRAALERWCKSNGAKLVAVFEDHGISGGAPIEKRAGLLAALAALTDTRAGVLLVAKRDRLARDVVAAAMIERLVERAGARVLTADGVGNGEGPEAGLMRGIVDLFAQYERALIRARTRAALAVKRSRGEKTGGDLPIGYRRAADSVHLAKHKAEQVTLARIAALRAAGLSPQAIADRLNAEKVPARGSKWHRTTVRRVLARVAC